jgi:hypothetical protein
VSTGHRAVLDPSGASTSTLAGPRHPPAGPALRYRPGSVVDALTPAQREVLDRLRGRDRPRPRFDPGLRERLRLDLESGLSAVAGHLEQPLFLGKSALGRVHACEAHHLAEEARSFEWTLPTAAGTVAHKAIELSVHRRDDPTPLDLVDGALARLEDDPAAAVATFLLGLDEAGRAELRSVVNDLVSAFVELWPPLAPAWYPRTEASLRAELCDGRIVLRGKADLTLGVPRGDEAGRLVVDLKAGTAHPGHADDLRFYAVLDTLRVGVPPFRLATYYLDAGLFAVEEVTQDVLDAAVRRTVAGVRAAAELRLGLRSAAVSPNPACRWCSARSGCDGARRWAEGSS